MPKRYRYESLALNVLELQNNVPGMPTVAVITVPITIDVTVDEQWKQDLDDYLTVKGWRFVGTLTYE